MAVLLVGLSLVLRLVLVLVLLVLTLLVLVLVVVLLVLALLVLMLVLVLVQVWVLLLLLSVRAAAVAGAAASCCPPLWPPRRTPTQTAGTPPTQTSHPRLPLVHHWALQTPHRQLTPKPRIGLPPHSLSHHLAASRCAHPFPRLLCQHAARYAARKPL